MTEICVVAPVYNEEKTIIEFVSRLIKNLEIITAEYEIILIDDGSTDETWRILRNQIAFNPKIKGLRFSRNFGQHYAISAGLQKTTSNWTIVMDSDLQDRPEVIPDLYRKARQGFDVVFVSRINRPEKFFYLATQRIFYVILKILSGINFDHTQANFSIINKKVVESFKLLPENARFYGSIIKWLGFKTSQISAQHGVRFDGKPSYTFKSRLRLALDIIMAFSNRPLKFAIGFGLLMSTISGIIFIWTVYGAYKSTFIVLGWPSLMSSIFFVGGSILVVLGILGAYIGRIYTEVKSRPLYVIAEEL